MYSCGISDRNRGEARKLYTDCVGGEVSGGHKALRRKGERWRKNYFLRWEEWTSLVHLAGGEPTFGMERGGGAGLVRISNRGTEARRRKGGAGQGRRRDREGSAAGGNKPLISRMSRMSQTRTHAEADHPPAADSARSRREKHQGHEEHQGDERSAGVLESRQTMSLIRFVETGPFVGNNSN